MLCDFPNMVRQTARSLVMLLVLLGSGPGRAGAQEPAKELTPSERAELDKRATALIDGSLQLYHQGKYVEAIAKGEQAVTTFQQLYPAAKFPDGHPDLAVSLNNLGAFLQTAGNDARAQTYQEQALAMQLRLYPADKFPDGHP